MKKIITADMTPYRLHHEIEALEAVRANLLRQPPTEARNIDLDARFHGDFLR